MNRYLTHEHAIVVLNVQDASNVFDRFAEFMRGHPASVFLSRVGANIVDAFERVLSLSGIYSLTSIVAVLVTIWVMQTTTRFASWRTRAGRVLWFKRVAFIVISCALTLNIMTPFIIPDPPWLSGLFVVIGFTLLMIVHALEYRMQIVRIDEQALRDYHEVVNESRE